MLRPPPSSPLFPYTTLFRSLPADLVLLAIGFEVTETGPLLDQAGLVRTGATVACGPDWQTAAPAVFESTCDSRSEEHTSELQSHVNLVCRLLLEKKKKYNEE